MRKLKVYLAGGMRSGWQHRVISELGGEFIFFNPCDHQIKTPKNYVKRDFELVSKSDIVFAFFEKTNPSGYGLAAEMGYAKGLKKQIVLVNQKRNKYTVFLDQLASHTAETLSEGISYLHRRGAPRWPGKKRS